MEIMGRGLSQIVQETPQYFHLFSKYAGWKLFKRRSQDVKNVVWVAIQFL